VELDLSEAFAAPPQEEAPRATEPPSVEIPVDLSPQVEAPTPPSAPRELDLSADFAALAGESAAETTAAEAPLGGPALEAPQVAKGFDYDEARVEVEFYLSQGFGDEARNAVRTLERKFPGAPRLGELVEMVEARAGAPAPHPVETPAAQLPATPPVPPEIPTGVVEPPPAVAGAEAAPTAAGGDLLGDLVGEFAEGFEGIGEPAAAPAGPAAAGEEASPLSGLLDELGEAGPAAAAQDDAETHYNLGVAFREMGLLDEAIGEFQKVLKRAQKGQYPPNFLQACSLLAVSFMDKGMPQIAAKWYARALEAPDLDDESTLALQYDLGVAFEQAGDTRNALEKFSEVYSQNIDYRDVAEKIRALQQKAN
jgi:tetratricopeptide (TPR) repeat protein